MPLRFVNRDFVTGIFDIFTRQKVCVSFAFKLFYASSLLTLQQHEQGWLLLLSIHTSSLSTLQPRLRSSEAVSSFSSRFIIFDSATRPYVLRAYCFQFTHHRFRLCNTVAENFRRKGAFKLLVYASSFLTLQHLGGEWCILQFTPHRFRHSNAPASFTPFARTFITFSLCFIVFDSATILATATPRVTYRLLVYMLLFYTLQR